MFAGDVKPCNDLRRQIYFIEADRRPSKNINKLYNVNNNLRANKKLMDSFF